MEKVNIAEKFGAFDEPWAPKVVGTVDNYEIKIVGIEGDFVWHSHADADELFLVIEGELRMAFRDREVAVGAGEFIVVPRGVEHRPGAACECKVLLMERRGVVNTGDGPASKRTRAPEPI